MVDSFIQQFFQCRQLAVVLDKTDLVESGRLQNDLNFIVMAMQPAAWMFSWQAADDMRSRKGKFFCDRIHSQGPFLNASAIAEARRARRSGKQQVVSVRADAGHCQGLLVLTG